MMNRILCLALLSLLSLPAQSAMLYSDRMLFMSTLGSSITDGYDNPPYVDDFYNNAAMSAVFGETDYFSTAITDTNRVTGDGAERHYCSGCNGSFLLDFTSTSVGDSSGVFGVGFDVFGNENVFGTNAFITFGDGSTRNEEIPSAGKGEFPFWGITDSLLIASIHFGGLDGATSTTNRMALDNLTIGSMGDVSAIPVPGAIWLFGSAMLGLAGLRRRTA